MTRILIANDRCEADLKEILDLEIRAQDGYETFKGGIEAFIETCHSYDQPISDAIEAFGVSSDQWAQWLKTAGVSE